MMKSPGGEGYKNATKGESEAGRLSFQSALHTSIPVRCSAIAWNLINMLRLIIAAAVLVSACLAYPQRREGAPADAANLQSFNPGALMPMTGGMPAGLSSGQFLPFNPNLQMGYKRSFDENLEQRKQHSQFNADENKAAFDSEDSLGNFMDFLHNEKGDKVPFANVDSAATDLGQFQPSAENEDGKFRFFDRQQ